MATVVNTPTTYVEKHAAALEAYSSKTQTISALQGRIIQPFKEVPAEVLQFMTNKNLEGLRTWLNGNYAIHDACLKELLVANEAIAQFKQALAACNPQKPEFSQRQIDHLRSLGYGSQEYQAKDAKHTEICGNLQQRIGDLESLVTKTKAYIAETTIAIDTAAFQLKHLENKTGILDRLPSRGYYYYEEGFKAYLASLQKPAVSTTEATKAAEPAASETTTTVSASASSAKPAATPNESPDLIPVEVL